MPGLRTKAEGLGHALPPLLVEAERLAATLILGDHGRRQAGRGEAFWQYRPATAGDPLRMIDWRRSGRGDVAYIRETEWQAAQSLTIWVDGAASMRFAGAPSRDSKHARASLLALALAVAALRGGERVGLAGVPEAAVPRAGRGQIARLYEGLVAQSPQEDYGIPSLQGIAPYGRMVMISDFFADPAPLTQAIAMAADRCVTGVLLQVLDPAEEDFPYEGRTIFQSVGGALQHETLQAGDLRAAYLDRLAQRKQILADLARASGWQFQCHHSGQPAQGALLWLYRALQRGR